MVTVNREAGKGKEMRFDDNYFNRYGTKKKWQK